MKIIDISLPIKEGMINYPGTTKTKITQIKSISGTSLSSEININSHMGTHIDAPSHSTEVENGLPIDKIPLEEFYGPCRVLDLVKCINSISIKDLESKNILPGEKILLKTFNSERGFSKFFDDYVFLSSDASNFLAEKNVSLVGIDSLSIKQRGSKDTTPHTAFLSQGIPILEGLNLKDVQEGKYTLCAFPLAFQEIDGSPVRAVLVCI